MGIEQSEKLAESLRDSGLKIDKIYTSPLKRAIQTAEILSHILHTEKPTPLPELIERDFGVMTGKKVSEIEKYCKKNILKTQHTTYFLSPKNAETFPELFERAKQVLKLLENESSEANILLVTHGDLGKMVYAAFYEIKWQDVLLDVHFKNADSLLLCKKWDHQKQIVAVPIFKQP